MQIPRPSDEDKARFRSLVPDGPVFLPAARWQDWILQRPWFAAQRLAVLPQPSLCAHRVSRAIADRRRDDYTLLEPVDESEAAVEDAFDDDLDDGD